MNCHFIPLPILTACLALLMHGTGCQQKPTTEVKHHTAAQDATTEQVCGITAALMYVPASSVNPSTTLGELGADELDFVELVMELEEHFDITISDETAEQLLGFKDEAGLNQVTMEKLAAVVEKQKRVNK